MCKNLFDKYSHLMQQLKIDCENCCGLCCVALYCSKSDGFPANKVAGVPCQNLLNDFNCSIHNDLIKKKMKGCLTYECFGAGQKVTQKIFNNNTWRNTDINKQKMFDVFVAVFQLNQIFWYLLQAISLCQNQNQLHKVEELILENENITSKSVDEILNFDIEKYRHNANVILKSIVSHYDKFKDNEHNFIGKNYKGKNLDGKNFSMAMLIGANLEDCCLNGASFLGCDMRDVNIKNADLSNSIFLTQMQINSAKGNKNTKLPKYISKPITW